MYKADSVLHTQRGHTVIEMLVVTAIIFLFAGALVFRSNDFGDQTILTNLAYEIAITIRQAQSSAMTGEATGDDSLSDYDNPVGIHFSKSSDDQFIKYVDNGSGDGYQAGSNDEKLQTFTLPDRYTIADVCVMGTSPTACFSTGVIDKADIQYEGPDSEADIYTSKGVLTTPVVKQISITIISDQSSTSTVSAFMNGQISVE